MSTFVFAVVLYEMNAADSRTVRSLAAHSARLRRDRVCVLVVDNTPCRTPDLQLPEVVTRYIVFGENMGLARAYEAALAIAKEESRQFLVLFDQDSEISSEYIDSLLQLERGDAAIWCPDVASGGTAISPYVVNPLGWPHFHPVSGADKLYGINSFSVVSVRFLEAIGGFDSFYWLDCLDTWLYEQAHRRGFAVRRLDVTVQHDLSLVSGKVSAWRMRNIAFYESCLALEFGVRLRGAGTILRLVLRGLKHRRVLGGGIGTLAYLGEIVRGARVGMKRRWGRVLR